MKFSSTFKVVAAVLLLFGAVAVDFTSKLMSIGFDLLFISLACWVIYPVIMKGLDDKE